MSSKVAGKAEYLVMNIGPGIQTGASVTIIGVTETLDAAKELVRNMKGVSAGRIVVAEKKTVITRAPVVELKESNETILLNPK